MLLAIRTWVFDSNTNTALLPGAVGGQAKPAVMFGFRLLGSTGPLYPKRLLYPSPWAGEPAIENDDHQKMRCPIISDLIYKKVKDWWWLPGG
jgi:hypothetical protein